MLTQATTDRVLLAIAVIGPVAGMLIGLAVGSVRRRKAQGMLVGLGIGLIGTLAFGMWRLYTAFGEAFGYDSVASIAALTAVFLAVGAGIGIAAAALSKRTTERESTDIPD